MYRIDFQRLVLSDMSSLSFFIYILVNDFLIKSPNFIFVLSQATLQFIRKLAVKTE